VHHGLSGEIATGAVSVLDDERLAETFRKPLRDQPRDNVRRTARDGTDDNAPVGRDRIALERDVK
jgi:hypothetical protein